MWLIDWLKSKFVKVRDPTKEKNVRRVEQANRSDYSLAGSEAIFSAVTRKSDTFATVPCHLYKDRKIQKNHPMERLIAYEPNFAQTPFYWKQTMEAYRNTEGNAYSFKVPDVGGGVQRLDILDPYSVEPAVNDDTGELFYWLTPKVGEKMLVHSHYIIHTRYICTNGFKGVSPIDVLRNSLKFDEDIKSFSLKELDSGVHSPVVLEVPSEISDDKKTKMVAKFMEVYKKSGGGLIVLDAGAKASRLAGSAVNSDLLAVERITKNRVATVYSLPPHMLGDYGDSSYDSNEQSMLEFIQLTMLSTFTMYEEEFNKKLLSSKEKEEGYYFAFDVDRLLLADTATRAEYNAKALRNAGRTPNENRRKEGAPDVEGGDELFISRDLVPLKAAQYLAESYQKSVEGGGNG